MTNTNRPQNTGISNLNSSIELLQKCADLAFANVFDVSASKFKPLWEIIGEKKAELEGAIAELESNKAELSLSQKADLEFIIGGQHYESDRLEEAIKSYKESLETLRNRAKSELLEDNSALNNLLQKQGAVLYHLGLCYSDLAKASAEEKKESYWLAANTNFGECLEKFELAEAEELAAKFINKQAEVLLELEAYEELQEIAEKALELHINYGSEEQIARDYGFLAEAAMHQSKWAHANHLAELALAIQNQSIGDSWEMGREDNSYLALLSESREQLQKWLATVERLETAREKTDPERDRDTYLQILKALEKLYFEQDRNAKAAEIQVEKLKIEYQYGLRAFIGARQLPTPQQSITNSTASVVAREIEASDRLQDVNNLLARIKSASHKLTVIYGKSGAGKSSLINAGLLPMLLQPGAIDNLTILPIVLRVYTDWLREPNPSTWNLISVLENLRKNDGPNQLKVLIFDQFEEFFAVCTKLEQRLPFYQFLRDCLTLRSVKVILSMRTDCLHHLLESDRLTDLEEVINYEILSKEVLYYLGNLSPANATNLIHSLTETTSLDFKPALIDEVVKDVTVEGEEIRPIELQLVGAELQSRGVTTLEEYRQVGDNPKEQLMDAFLDRIVKECGFQKERLAILVLYSLTEKNNLRPLKTRAQIAEYLSTDTKKVDEILEIFAIEGLVLLIPDVPDDRYQLAHDYLVRIIRQQKGEKLIAGLQLERDKAQRKLLEERPNNFIDRAISSVFRWMRDD
ncbi:MAG: hypothetical protein SXA11_18090 [Cyanobacteriota bacterium]|nr:hypothetical protein [Cyanobacteriota bacterium]